MTRLTDGALAELARLAEEATPGPWRTVVKGNTVQFLAIEGVCSGISPKTRNGPFIAAADPSTVAALVAEVRRLRAAVRWTLGENEGEPHFPAIDERPVGAGPYWWRKELRRRAALDGDA